MHRIAAVLLLLLCVPVADAVPGRVFRINPIVGLADPAFRDNPLSLDNPAFEGALMDVELPPFERVVDAGGRTVGWGNERFTMVDAPLPPDGQAVRREDPRFLEQMAWFYLNHAVDRLEALGYVVPFPDPLPVHAHSTAGVWLEGVRVPAPAQNNDASCCNGGIRLLFRSLSLEGQGGMGSAAEDAEVIVHEFGHYVHFQLAAVQYQADLYGEFAEGTADLLAVLLLDDLSGGVSDGCQGEWLITYYTEGSGFEADGYTCTRALDNNFVWPQDEFGRIHHDGMFWSGPMWRIREALGTETTLRLLMETLSRLPEDLASFEQLGRVVLLSDAALYGGRDEAVIRSAFAAHGIEVPALEKILGNSTVRPPIVADPGFVQPSPEVEHAERNESPSVLPVALVVVLLALVLARRRCD